MSTSNPLFSQLPLGMNSRNDVIRALNSRASLRLAKDKISFKHVLEENGVATPRTYHEIHDFSDISLVDQFPGEFVVKPSKGFAGKGVMLLERKGPAFVNPSGESISARGLKRHIRAILDGDYSGYMEQDAAIIEQRIYPSPKLDFKNLVGLPDIRVFCYEFEPVMAMLRYPTVKSRGRSNLAQGSIGMGVDIERGTITRIHSKKETREVTPEELEIPASFVMPAWPEILAIARRASELANLGISGVDIVIGANDTVLVLEINGRPGLEIQNINELSLAAAIQRRAATLPARTRPATAG